MEKTNTRVCIECSKEYIKNTKFSISQWRVNKFCSNQCSGKAKKKHDNFKSRGERWRRKNGMLKQGSKEFRDLISKTTKDGMKSPLVQKLITAPRSPLQTAHRQNISKALTGRMPSNTFYYGSSESGPYSNVKRGDYDINGKTMYFRSRWEANYALYLDFLKNNDQIRNWKYESRVFIFEQIKFGTRSYRPDFEVINNDGSIDYHEIKGYMDSKSKTKLKRMRRYYPEERILLIDKDFYFDLKKKMGRLLKFYE